jgi:hypothetical protein
VIPLLLLGAPRLHADTNPLVNPGFETGDLTGWTVSGTGAAAVLPDFGGLYFPQAGNWFLGQEDGGGTESDVFQEVTLKAGDVLQGWGALLGTDPGASASVDILNANTLAPVANPYTDTGDGGPDPWTEWTWTAPTAGSYRLDYNVTTGPDSGAFGFFDAGPTQITPEPGTCTLVLLGLAMVGGRLRPKRRA